MRAASSQLISLLLTGNQFFAVDLWQITLSNGVTLYYSDYPVGIKLGTQLYLPDSIGLQFTRNKVKSAVGVQVDELEVDIAFDNTNQNSWVQGNPFPVAARQGVFDGAKVVLQRAIMPSSQDISAGAYTLFVGFVSDIDIQRFSVKMKIKSVLERLTVQMPRNLYQPGCMNTLFDSQCTLLASKYFQSGHVGPNSSLTTIVTDIVNPFGDGDFNEGKIQFKSGVNNTLWRTVKQHAGGTLTLHFPLPKLCAIGDIVAVYPGCNKTISRCTGRYNNIVNFHAAPYVPAPETAY